MGPSLDAKEAVTRFKKKHSLTFPLLTEARATAAGFGVKAYPTMFLVGKDGKVKWKGHFKDEALTAAIEKEVGGK